MDKNRLITLRNHLRKVASEAYQKEIGIKFHMSKWAEIKTAEEPNIKRDFDNMRLVVDAPKCEMSACAGGHAALIPEFKAAGLKLVQRRGMAFADIVYLEHKGYEACAAFFDIYPTSAQNIFDPEKYTDSRGYGIPYNDITPDMVADKINKLLDANI